MKKYFGLIMLVALIANPSFAATSKQEAINKSKAMVKELGMGLKQKLQAAMKEGGPVNAIPVCKAVGQVKAKEISDKHSASVRRVSLKLRNQANAPDEYETGVLKQMEKDNAAKALKPAYVSVVEINGKKNLRFMKPIVTNPVCMHCHGASVKPEVVKILEKEYPDDKATGYGTDMVRGAFTVIYPMN